MRRALTAAVVLGLAGMTAAVGEQASAAKQSEAVRQASSVTVQPLAATAIPEGDAGIAAKYPGDAGIEQDPDVVFAESFEGSVDEICSHWEAAAGRPIMSKSEEKPPGSAGKQSLLLTRVAGGTDGYLDGGSLYRRLKNATGGYGYNQLFFRFYMKFNQEHAPIHHYGSGLAGFHPPTPWPQGGAGDRPKADARWSTQVEPGRFDTWRFYSYWGEMGGRPAARSDLGQHLRDRSSAAHRSSRDTVDLPRSHGQDERRRRLERRASLLARRET